MNRTSCSAITSALNGPLFQELTPAPVVPVVVGVAVIALFASMPRYLRSSLSVFHDRCPHVVYIMDLFVLISTSLVWTTHHWILSSRWNCMNYIHQCMSRSQDLFSSDYVQMFCRYIIFDDLFVIFILLIEITFDKTEEL